jgi:excisionase family DNA binding protein
MKQAHLMSRREAARVLGVSYPFVDKLAAKNDIKQRKLPGHSRVFYPRAEIETLASQFEMKG